MRIASLVASPGVPARGPSGSSAHVRGLARGLEVLGHDVTIWAARAVDRRGAHGEPVRVVETGAPGWPSWLEPWRELSEVWAARRLARALVERAHAGEGPDLILERHGLWSDAGWRASDALGVPWVLEVNAPLLAERARYETVRLPRLAARWERDVLRAAPVIVAVSDWLVGWLVGEIGCKNVHKVWNGCEALPGSRPAGRARLGVPEGQPVIGLVGSMKPWHGLEAAARLARALGARLALVGPAPAEPIPDALLTGHLGPQALSDVVAALDLGLAPYPADAPPWFCPLKILDYRAQGTPVLASDLGEARGLVGEGGELVPPGDEAALLEAARRWLGRRAPVHARPWRRVAEEVLALINSDHGPIVNSHLNSSTFSQTHTQA